ncbi:cobyric acid synthase [Chloroflexota bacterium]
MKAKTLMVQGTSSSAGKSLLVTALCHIFAGRGLRVAPFKAQNMSNNAAVCPDGSEIGRSQAVQALAAGIQPQVDINPILIKPEADARAQIIVNGRPYQTLNASVYYEQKDILWGVVTGALDRLRASFDLVIIEGAGSPAEINLRSRDIVNMEVALYAQSPVLLVGDIDRGGIFAQLLGTLWLLAPEERALVKGLVINKFRGDLDLFSDGVRMLEEKGQTPVLGVIPFLKDLNIPEEDAVALDNPGEASLSSAGSIDIAVIHLPLISNFDDFDPLAAEEGVSLRYISSPHELGKPDVIILPGTKSTVADLAWLRAQGLARCILEHAQNGGAVVGICGGYQMMGETITDLSGVEAQTKSTDGLGLLDIQTQFHPRKATSQTKARIQATTAWMANLDGQFIEGYEIHMGHSQTNSAWININERNGDPANLPDGGTSPDGRLWGCYIHGLFNNAILRRAWLASLGWQASAAAPLGTLDQALDILGRSIEAALDMERLEKIIWAD